MTSLAPHPLAPVGGQRRLESALRSLGPIGEAKMAEAYAGRR